MPPRLPPLRTPPIGFAHRGGAADAPQNTLAAFTRALERGATGLESDAWITADGKVVLDHDGVVGGRLRRRPIRSSARDELAEHIPSLPQLYANCGTDFELSLDVKDPDAIAEIVAAARDVGAEARLWVCHPDADLVASWRELSPSFHLVHSTRVERIKAGIERHVASLRATGVDALNLHHSEWTGGGIALCHRFELLALAWDAQFDRTLDAVLDAGIDGVFSDHVERMMRAIDRWR